MSDGWVAFGDEDDASAVDDFDVVDDEEAILDAALAAARAEFGDFDLELGELVRPGGEHSGLPVLAVVGRPNVGKSTLVNRMIGRREAVVEDVPGVTRDRVTYEAEWNGRRFVLIDTGGWDLKARGIAAAIAKQAERAINDADAVLFIVDAAVGATDTDEAVVEVLRRSGKPVLLVANKVDDQATELEATALWGLGLGEPHPVSALHGRGAGDLLDAAVALLPETGSGIVREAGPRRVALLGKPNVGKSSLLNALDPHLSLRVAEVSRENEKGRHTTTTARLIPHALGAHNRGSQQNSQDGGAFVDTPGVRQFQLWQIVPAEVPAAFRDLRSLANLCRFPDCSHTHELDCAVKHAVADGLVDTRRWESCCHLAATTGADDADTMGDHDSGEDYE
jgi:small GTP-binding protein